MIYSCWYWNNAKTLNEAQEAKLKLVCSKLFLKPGMKILDIGCGLGGAAKYLVENYDVEVVGITVSDEQKLLAQDFCRDLPIKVIYQDYRDVTGNYDRIYSIGMFEHVGVKNYRAYMKKIKNLLTNDGISLLHTIGRITSKVNSDPWTARYIFPNSMLPSENQITRAYEGLFVMEDWHNFGIDYDKTLMAWKDNFESAWSKLKNIYDNRFYRMWKYYLLSNAGAFRARHHQLWQIILSTNGVEGGLNAPR